MVCASLRKGLKRLPHIVSADLDSDTTSTLSYAAAEESFEEGDVLANGMYFTSQELGDPFLMSPLS